MIAKERRRRIEFFANHGGYVTPPGRMVCAKNLADAEERRETLEADGTLVVRWEDDVDPDLSWADADTLDKLERGVWVVVGCIATLYDPDLVEPAIASLWGIVVEPGDPYIRVVEAELVSELIAELNLEA